LPRSPSPAAEVLGPSQAVLDQLRALRASVARWRLVGTAALAAVAGGGTGTKWHGIYEVKGNTLRAVVGKIDQAPPTDLNKPAEGTRSFLLKRAR
jgi:hypothetical protein